MKSGLQKVASTFPVNALVLNRLPGPWLPREKVLNHARKQQLALVEEITENHHLQALLNRARPRDGCK